MVSSNAATPDEYLEGLHEATRVELETVLAIVREAMPQGFQETMDFGMITWSVPLSSYPDTYNKRPLMYAALAAQKRYNSLYLMGSYAVVDRARLDEGAIRARWAGGKPLDMGKSCVRFRRAADLDLGLIAEVLAQWTVADYVANAQAARGKK